MNFVPVVQAFRRTSGSYNMLAMECFLHCAEKPRTMAELEVLTGSTNGRLSRAVRQLTAWYDKKAEKVIRPEMHLLQRRRVINGRGHRIHVTAAGRRLLEGSY